MKTKIFSIMLILVLSVLLLSCGTSTEPAKLNVDAFHTEAVGTFSAGLTQTAEAIPTFTPTLTLEPTLTPTVTATGDAAATPTKNRCYNLLYLKDVTVPDGTALKPNEVFTKTWLVQNNGDCAWAPGFMFVNVGGDPMLGTPVKLVKPVPVGLKYELSVDMVVPTGVYGLIQGSWRMAYEPGMYFGDTLSVNIRVDDPNGPTPTPTATP